MGAKSRLSGIVFVIALSAAAAAFIVLTSAGFPDVGATHFDASGRPNATMSRNFYRGYMVFLVVVVPLLVAGLPALLARHWPMLLNIPNREHWLAPERIDATLASIQARTAVLASAMILLMCFVHMLVLSANAGDRPELDQGSLLIGIGLFASFTLGWILSLWRRFRSADSGP
jgi:hypothetical protein